MSNEFEYFDFKGRKQVMGVTLYSRNDLSKNILDNTLIEALTLDENVKYYVVKK